MEGQHGSNSSPTTTDTANSTSVLKLAKMEIVRLHYKDEKVFPFEKYVTKRKENFRVLEKDKSERRTEKQQAYCMTTSDVGIEDAKTTVFHSHQNSFDEAVHFMSAYISNCHAGAQVDTAEAAAVGAAK